MTNQDFIKNIMGVMKEYERTLRSQAIKKGLALRKAKLAENNLRN